LAGEPDRYAETVQGIPPAHLKRWGLICLARSAFRFAALARRAESGQPGGSRPALHQRQRGQPKAVVLTHRNILANTAQIGAVLGRSISNRSSARCRSPQLWLHRDVLVAAPGRAAGGHLSNPLDAQKLIETIERHKLQLLITTPTFLRAFLRKAKPNSFAR